MSFQQIRGLLKTILGKWSKAGIDKAIRLSTDLLDCHHHTQTISKEVKVVEGSPSTLLLPLCCLGNRNAIQKPVERHPHSGAPHCKCFVCWCLFVQICEWHASLRAAAGLMLRYLMCRRTYSAVLQLCFGCLFLCILLASDVCLKAMLSANLTVGFVDHSPKVVKCFSNI